MSRIIGEFLGLIENINWIIEEPPPNGNEYIQEVVIYLESLFRTAQRLLDIDTLYTISTSVLKHISDSIVSALLSENVKRFTLSSVMGIDHDLKTLESFAEERYQTTGLCDMKKDSTLVDCLVEARQFINLLMSSQPENFVNPVIRQKNYWASDYKKVSTICDKFKDSPDGLFGTLGRNTKQNARKKSMDTLKRRLRDYN